MLTMLITMSCVVIHHTCGQSQCMMKASTSPAVMHTAEEMLCTTPRRSCGCRNSGTKYDLTSSTEPTAAFASQLGADPSTNEPREVSDREALAVVEDQGAQTFIDFKSSAFHKTAFFTDKALRILSCTLHSNQ